MQTLIFVAGRQYLARVFGREVPTLQERQLAIWQTELLPLVDTARLTGIHNYPSPHDKAVPAVPAIRRRFFSK